MMTDLALPEVQDAPDNSGVDITAVTKLKHADLWRVAKQLGSQSALARHLGIQPTELCDWINLKTCPPAEPVGRRWTEDYLTVMEGKLLALTGKSWDELFPPELRNNVAFLACSKTIERTERIHGFALVSYAERTRRRLELQGNQDSAVSREELRNDLEVVLRTLSARERDIIRWRYGLNDGQGKTLDEVSEIMKVTSERIRQIEMRAIRKMQQPYRAQQLVGHLD